MMIESKYSTNDEKDAVLSLLIVPVLMLLYARYLFKKNEKWIYVLKFKKKLYIYISKIRLDIGYF